VARLSQTVVVSEHLAAELLGPRRDLLVERPWTDADDQSGLRAASHGPSERPEGAEVRQATYAIEQGAMAAYRRDVTAVATGEPERVSVTETTEFRTALGVWGLFVVLPIRRALRRVKGRQSTYTPPWGPPQTLDLRSATVLGLLLTLAYVAGYVGTVMTQTIAFAADDFGRGTGAQGGALAAVRVGALGSLALVAMSDRRGRRRLLLGSAAAACILTVVGALSPTLEVLTVSQTLARCFATATTLLLAVVAAEEMPAGARAYAISVMTMTGALGAGLAVGALSFVDRAEWGWRVLYVIPVLGLPIVARTRHRLPESQRFVRPHRDATVIRGHAARFWAIGAALFCSSAFGAPSSQLLNDFLRDERGFSSSRIAIFTFATTTPAGIALVAGGHLADTRGRRQVVAVGVAGGALVGAWGFTQAGWPLWAANLGSTMLGALAVPALGAYGPELFPTAARAKANGIIQVVSVAGSAIGLVVAGTVAERTGRLSNGMFLLLPLALLVAALALIVFPETARRELEDINPEDALDPAFGVAGADGLLVVDPLVAPSPTPDEADPPSSGPPEPPSLRA